MRFCIQVVKQASVGIEGRTVSSIGPGMLVLLGVGKEDDEAVADKMIAKLLKMRIFSDPDGKTNLSLGDIEGELLLVSQFTLYGDARGGRRPSYIRAAAPDAANAFYERLVNEWRGRGIPVETGRFRTEMQVKLINDGPVTILLDSEKNL